MNHVAACNAHFQNLMNIYDKIDIFRNSENLVVYKTSLETAFHLTKQLLTVFGPLIMPNQAVALRTFYMTYAEDPALEPVAKTLISEVEKLLLKLP